MVRPPPTLFLLRDLPSMAKPASSESTADIDQALREIERGIPRAMLADQHRMRSRLRSIRAAKKNRRPFDRNLARLQDDLERSLKRRTERESRVPLVKYDDELPVSAMREEICTAIREHQVVVICGETGSGKSTQLPKMCLEMGRGLSGMIGHTQPRRIAARSVAARISEELAAGHPQAVAFKIRFTDTSDPHTYIKLMTDGILLAETQGDRFLEQYDTIIIDEAHERSLNIDFLMGYIKRLLPRRPDLKVIITSATIDAERFSKHFADAEGNAAPVIEVSGRTYPVEVRYRPIEADDELDEPDPEQALCHAVNELAEHDTGDILIFLPTEREIRETAKMLRGRSFPGDRGNAQTEILPLYGRLSTAEQNRVFRSHPHRRIVLATNVAESSLTVPGIRSVIDTGTARISRYAPRSKVQRLPIEPISQASADQRKGRCGRVGPGICIRLYSQQDYESRERFTQPEIQRTNLAAVVLQTLTLGLGEVQDFPFLDPPKPTAVKEGYKTLFELGAIDTQNQITDIGRKLGRLPVDPRIGRMILAADEENCLHEVLIIAAALEVRDPRDRPIDKQQAADEAHAQFVHEDSDFLSFLKLWDFAHHLRETLSRSKLRKACAQNFLSYNRLREWSDVYHQLLRQAEQAGLKQKARRDDPDAIHRALLTGLLSNIAMKGETHEYTAAGGQKLHLWPGSGTFARKPKWIMAAELVETTKRYARTIARIQPQWIEPLAGHLLKYNYSDPTWDGEKASAVADERVSLFGLTIVPRRTVRYGRVNPVKAREFFIQYGLVEGDYETNADFWKHNRALIEEVEAMEAKSRQRDLLRGEEDRFAFYDERLGEEAVDGATFDKWRRKAEKETPKLLFFSRADLLHSESEALAEGDFPDVIEVAGMRLPLEYHLEPGSEEDGITVTVPQEALQQIDRNRLGWLVPGLLEEKIVALIKSLPKPLRRMLVPAPDTAREVLQQIRFGEGNFEEQLAGILRRISGEIIPVEEFRESALPRHLRMNLRVVDAAGESVAKGRELNQLREEAGTAAAASLADFSDSEWNRKEVRQWDFGPVPEKVTLERGHVRLQAWPALVDDGDTAALKLCDAHDRAIREHRKGLRRLFALQVKKNLRAHVDHLPQIDRLVMMTATIPGFDLRRQLADLIADRAFFVEPTLPRNPQQWDTQYQRGRNQLSVAAQDVTKLCGPLFDAYQAARKALQKARGGQWQYALNDMQQQFAEIFTPQFLTTTPWPWLVQIPRYCQAIVHRLDKLSSGDIRRDQPQFQQLQPRVQRCRKVLAELEQQGRFDPAVEQHRWMLEELRVSMFAQKLGTAITISLPRIDKHWETVKRPS